MTLEDFVGGVIAVVVLSAIYLFGVWNGLNDEGVQERWFIDHGCIVVKVDKFGENPVKEFALPCTLTELPFTEVKE